MRVEVFGPTVNLKWNFYWVIGKSPLFEIRHMDADDNDSLKFTLLPEKSHIEESNMNDGKDVSSDIESDEEEVGHPPSWSKKQSTSIYVKKQSSPVCVYTYKVNSSSLHLHSFFSWFSHYKFQSIIHGGILNLHSLKMRLF